MELIISILFFAVAGAICVRLFVSAHLLSNESVNINNSNMWTQNIAEVFSAKHGNIHKITEYYKDTSILLVSYEENPEIGTLVMFFDPEWNLIEYPSSDSALENAQYELILTVSQLPAGEVYQDTDIAVSELTGDSLLGEIMVRELFPDTPIDQAPEATTKGIITERSIDYYIGKWEG
jgi:hypothetical protein